MSKKLLTLAFCAALAVFASAWLSGAAQAGPTNVCGNGDIEDPPEKCDDGNEVPDDTCSFPSCLPRVCGDSIVNPDPGTDEQCDDGNTDPNDGCDANCQLECGNGTIEGAETCDDMGESATCDDDCTAVACGDGNTNTTAGEECDPPAVGECSDECLNIARDEQTKKQQGCINAVNKNLAGVAKAQGGEISKCVKDAAKGGAATCFVAGAKTTKAGDKTTKTITGKKCTTEPPDFALTDAATVNGAGSDEMLEGMGVVLGDPPVIAQKATDKDGAKCQAEVVKQYNAVASKYLAEANKAKKSALKGGKGGTPLPAGNLAEIATGVDAGVAASNKIAQAESKANTGIDKKCAAAQVDALFDCGGATTVNELTLCVIREAKEAACNALEAADGLSLNCPSDLIP